MKSWRKKRASETKAQPSELRGWKQISDFLGMPISTAQRWAKTGMPVSHEARYVTALPEELNRWLDRQTGLPPEVHVATQTTDLSADLRRALAATRGHKKTGHKKTRH